MYIWTLDTNSKVVTVNIATSNTVKNSPCKRTHFTHRQNYVVTTVLTRSASNQTTHSLSTQFLVVTVNTASSWRRVTGSVNTHLAEDCSYTVRTRACNWWWLTGSSGGSLVAAPDCKPAVPGSNPAISPAYSGLPILGWAAIWDGTPL